MNTYWKKTFGWSKSRQGLLEDCPRAYYYNYIGRYEFGKEGANIVPLLKLQKFHFLKGNLIHQAIRNQITQHCLGRPVSLEAAKNFISIEFNKVLNNQQTSLSEAYNGFPFEPDFLSKEKEDSLNQINTFFTVLWHSYKDLEFLTHERLESFMLGNFKVWVQPDLVTKNARNELTISDWKTGSPVSVDSDGDLQLSVYILWASLHFSCEIKNIGAELVYLKTSQSFPTRRALTQIEEVKKYIHDESGKMLAAADKSEFNPTPKLNLCKGCNFSTICEASAVKKSLVR